MTDGKVRKDRGKRKKEKKKEMTKGKERKN